MGGSLWAGFMVRLLVVAALVAGGLPASEALVSQAAAQTPADPDDPEAPGAGEREELTGKRDKYQKVFKEPDGSFTAEIHTQQIHVKQNGKWEDADPSLEPCPNTGCAYRNRRGPFSVEFAATADDPELIALHDRSLKLAYGLAGAAPSEPVVDGARITYPGVFPGADLVFNVGVSQVEELIVLHGPPDEPFEFRFPLDLKNLSAQVAADGSVEVTDKKGTVEFTFPPMMMTDSATDAESLEPALSEGIALAIETKKGVQTLVVTPDFEWLTDPARNYPVTIDPPVTKQPDKDTFVQSNISNTPQDTASTLKSGTYNSGSVKAQSLFKFDVADLAGASITGATFSLYEEHSWSCTPSEVQVYGIADQWSTNVVWSNKPSYHSPWLDELKVAKGYSGGCAANWINFDVKDAVLKWLNGTWDNRGLAVRAKDQSDNYGWKKFSSDNTSNKPKLVITYTIPDDPPLVPTGLTPSSGTYLNVPPTLGGRYDDPNPNDGGWLEFEVTDASGARKADRGTFAEPGNYSYWTVPGPLADGVYNWRAYAWDHDDASGWSSTKSFVIDTEAPDPPNITDEPTSPGNDPSPTWEFTGEPGATFECRLTRQGTTVAGWSGCSSPRSYGLSSQPDGIYLFEVRQIDRAGNVSGEPASATYEYDTTAPDPPTITAEPPSPSSNAFPSWSFVGQDGYPFACRLKFEGTVIEGAEPCTSPRSYDLTQRPDGNFTFQVRQTDPAGNDSGWASSPYLLDRARPAAPVVWAEHPHTDPNKWYRDQDVTFSWSVANPPPSGISGYSFELDHSPSTEPNFEVNTTATSKQYSALDSGRWHFHVRARSGAGQWSDTGHASARIDATVPEPPAALSSTTHVPYVAFQSREIEMQWQAGSDAHSGVAGYSYALSTSSSPTLDAETEAGPNVRNRTITAPDDGTYYFHIATVDNVGHASEPVTYGPILIDDVKGAGIGLSPLLDGILVAQSDQLGLEQFYAYESKSLGTAAAFSNLHTGNLVIKQPDVTIPGIGLNVAVSHTYNSHYADPLLRPSALGEGWTLSVSDVEGGFEGIENAVTSIDPNAPLVPAPFVNDALQVAGQVLELTDGDGTTHRFIRDGVTPGSRWSSPPGVSLRVREVTGATGVVEAYELIRPDGVVYRAEGFVLQDVDPNDGIAPPTAWRVVSIADRNGNQLTFDYDVEVPFVTDVRVTAVNHSAYDDPVAEFRYGPDGFLESIDWLPAEVASADPASGDTRVWRRTSYFDVDASGELTEVIDNAHLPAGDPGKRSTTFGYSSSSGKSLLARASDGRGNPTLFSYGAGSGTPPVTAVTDRAGKDWTYTYDPGDGMTTTATSPVGAATVYETSSRAPIADGRIAGANIERITDAGNNAGPVRSTYRWRENRLVERTTGTGHTTNLFYDDLGLLTRVVSPSPNDPGRADLPSGAPTTTIETTFSYEAVAGFSYGNCTEPTEESPAEVSRERYCDAVAEMVSSVAAANIDGQQRQTDFVYDQDGNLTDVVGIDGDPTGSDRHTRFTYYDAGLLRSIDGPRTGVADVTIFGNDVGSDPFGGYHRSGSPRRITDADGKIKRFAYTPYGLIGKITDRDGRVTTTLYDERDNPVATADPDGDVASAVFDANDNLVSATSPRGNATGAAGDFTATTTYDALDRPIRAESPGVDEAERIVATTNYFADGAIKNEVGPTGATTTYSYYPNRQVASVTAPVGTGQTATAETFYDASGRTIETIGPPVNSAGARPRTKTFYTPSGAVAEARQTSSTGALDRIVRLAYDAHGAVIESLGPRANDNGLEEAQVTEYDSFGQATRVRRRLNQARFLDQSYRYDLAGNTIEVTLPEGTGGSLTATFAYDSLNRLESQTDPHNPGHTTTYTYLAEGQQQTRVDRASGAAVRTVTSSYNADYSLRSQVFLDHDTGGRLSECRFDQGQDPSSGYDADGNLLHSRSVEGDCDQGTTIESTELSYDHAGRPDQVLTRLTVPGAAPVTRTERLHYRADSALTSITRIDGGPNSGATARTTTYEHSPAGVLEAVTDWRGASTSRTTYDHLASGAVTTVELGGVATGSFAYHPDGSPRSLVWDALGHASPVRSHSAIAYDPGGLRTAETVAIVPAADPSVDDPGGDAAFSFDLAGRLTSWTSPFGAEQVPASETHTTTYTLDDASNITAESVETATGVVRTRSATYERSRLSAATDATFAPAGVPETTTTTTFTYSSIGEERTRESTTTTAAGAPEVTDTRTTAYDPASHTKDIDHDRTIQGAGVQAPPDVTYTYSASDRLLARTEVSSEQTTTTLYLYGAVGGLAEETDATGTTITRYLLTPSGSPLAEQRLDDASFVFLLADPAGNVATELQDDGTVLAQRAYDPYGAPDPSGSSTEATDDDTSSLGFQGALTDDATGNLILGPRIYDPTTDRFTTPDFFVASGADMSLGTDPLTGNRYLFAAANPVAFYDDGHMPLCDGHYCGPSGSSAGRHQRSQCSTQGCATPATIQSSLAHELQAPTTPRYRYVEFDFGTVSFPAVVDRLARRESSDDDFSKWIAVGLLAVMAIPIAAEGLAAAGTSAVASRAGPPLIGILRKIQDKVAGPSSRAAKDVVVLGNFPEYVKAANRIGARYFNVPSNVWGRMTSAERWTANQKFLDRAINRGAEIRLASSPLVPANMRGQFGLEVNYLLKQGYSISSYGRRMIPPGG